MYELTDLARTVPNLIFSLSGIYMAHSLNKTSRKAWQCIAAWALLYVFWVLIGIPLDALLIGNPALPNVTHERICMFIGPAAIAAYRYIFPKSSMSRSIFCYFMVNTTLILQILFSRTAANVICQLSGAPYTATVIICYLLVTDISVFIYIKYLRERLLRLLSDFGSRMRFLAVYSAMCYFGSLFVADVWAPWGTLDVFDVLHNLSAVLVPLCGYGVALLGISVRLRADELERTSVTDPLTGLKNRRGLINDIRQLAEMDELPVMLLYLDLNGFKSVNDRYGHEVGDRYLKRFAKAIKQYPGVKGYAYRLGGDEFAVLYKDGAAGELLPIREFAEERFLSDGEFPAFSGVSIGFERLTDENDLHKTLRLADEMMYKEKKNSSQTRE